MKITQLPAAGAAQADDLIPIVQDGETKRATRAQFVGAVPDGLQYSDSYLQLTANNQAAGAAAQLPNNTIRARYRFSDFTAKTIEFEGAAINIEPMTVATETTTNSGKYVFCLKIRMIPDLYTSDGKIVPVIRPAQTTTPSGNVSPDVSISNFKYIFTLPDDGYETEILMRPEDLADAASASEYYWTDDSVGDSVNHTKLFYRFAVPFDTINAAVEFKTTFDNEILPMLTGFEMDLTTITDAGKKQGAFVYEQQH